MVVSNTSPVSNLAILGRLDLVREQFGRVLVPPAVGNELSALEHPGGAEHIRQALASQWLLPVPLASPTVARVLQEHLHPGEAEAIALALERNADLLLIDEAEGREAATAAGLRVRGVLGILRKARQTGHLQSLRFEIQRLRDQAHFFVAADLEKQLLKAVGEE